MTTRPPPPTPPARGGGDKQASPSPCGRGLGGGGVARRSVLQAATALLAIPFIARAQTTQRVIVIGGGFGGATAARFLRRADPRIDVVLVEPNATFTACPFSNEVIVGLRDIAAQRFDYRGDCGNRRPRGAGHRDRHRPVAPQRHVRRQSAALRPADPLAGHRPRLERAARLRRSCGGANAARLEGRRADSAAAPPARGNAGWRRGGDLRTAPIRIAVHPALTSAPA